MARCCRAAKHANTSRYQTATKPVHPIQTSDTNGSTARSVSFLYCTRVPWSKHCLQSPPRAHTDELDVDVDEDVDDDDEDVDDVDVAGSSDVVEVDVAVDVAVGET